MAVFVDGSFRGGTFNFMSTLPTMTGIGANTVGTDQEYVPLSIPPVPSHAVSGCQQPRDYAKVLDEYVRLVASPSRNELLRQLFDDLMKARTEEARDRLVAQLTRLPTPKELLHLAAERHSTLGNDDRIRWAARLLSHHGSQGFEALREFLGERPEYGAFFVGLAVDDTVFAAHQRRALVDQLLAMGDDDIDDRLVDGAACLVAEDARRVLGALASRVHVAEAAQERLAELG